MRRFAPVCACLAAFTLSVAPWTIRNYVHWGRLIPLSTKSGVNAWMWNHPGLVVEFGTRAFEGPKPIDIFDAEIQDLPNEAERDAKLMRLFVEFVADQPMKFAGLVLVRLAMAVAPVSVSSEYHGGSTVAALSAWYIKGIPLIALVAAGVLLRARLWWRIRPLGLFVGYWMVMQSLAGPGIRYRLPADPVWACIIGVIGAAVLAKTLRGPGTDPLARRWGPRFRCPEALPEPDGAGGSFDEHRGARMTSSTFGRTFFRAHPTRGLIACAGSSGSRGASTASHSSAWTRRSSTEGRTQADSTWTGATALPSEFDG